MSEETLLEDEPGQGHFQIKIEIAGEKTYEKVPAIDITKILPSEYIKSQFEKGIPFLAFREGQKGMCTVLINQERLIVEKINTTYNANPFSGGFLNGNKMIKQEITEEDFYKPIVINPLVVSGEPENVEIKGKLKDGNLPFWTKIYFVSSY